MKKGSDPQMIMAYLYKHTPLQTNVQMNLTCLVPTSNPDVAAPQRVSLKAILRYFIDFRMQTVTKRLEFELAQLLERIHILSGFIVIFDALDEAISMIRRSEGKSDASQKLMERFELDDVQVDAILELKLYRLAKLQVAVIREELQEKQKQASRVQGLLKSEPARWKLVRSELEEVSTNYADRRRTRIVAKLDEPEYDAEDFIVDEDMMVVVTRQGWVKRQQKVKDVGSIRVRKGDEVLMIVAGSTRSAIAFFTNRGVCYVARIVDIVATTGHGAPLQAMFKMNDGERVVGVTGLDPRFLNRPPFGKGDGKQEGVVAIAVTRRGLALRFSLRTHCEPSTRGGRKFARLQESDEVIYVALAPEGGRIACVSEQRRALVCATEDVSLLNGAGRGILLIKLVEGDHLLATRILVRQSDALIVRRKRGSDYSITLRKYEPIRRGGKGFQLFMRGEVEAEVRQEPEIPNFPE